MEKLLHYKQIIDSELNKLIISKEFNTQRLYAPVKYVLSIGGKRIRPALVLMACEAFSNNITNAIYPALAIEIFHNFTLLHDDIMDKAEMRRSKPTVHKKWDENTAILSGDAMSILAYQFLSNTKAEFLPQILDVFNETALEVCEGQQYDMDFESETEVGVDDYLEMIKLKTSVLLAGSLKIGAIIGGATAIQANHLYQFGLNIGLAFQLQDDYLDTFGDEKTFGKKIGNDIIANKKTFLLVSALKEADEKMKQEMARCFQITDNDLKIKKVKALYEQLEIPALTRQKMHDLHNRAFDYLKDLDVHEERKTNLFEISEYLLHRFI